ncbi:hypothetical protein [Kribbella deserti]|uniref:Uncharacterized protein n=1 Tax=Kribbella deserti TaxID=1926257 RepID=A0ABV6QH04_9ACTN
MRSTLVNRLVRLATTGAMVAGGLALIGAPSEAAPPKRTEGHVTGDAWISFSLDPGNPCAGSLSTRTAIRTRWSATKWSLATPAARSASTTRRRMARAG